MRLTSVQQYTFTQVLVTLVKIQSHSDVGKIKPKVAFCWTDSYPVDFTLLTVFQGHSDVGKIKPKVAFCWTDSYPVKFVKCC